MQRFAPAGLVAVVLTASGCGQPTGGSDNAAGRTIDFIQKNGFPKLSTLMPLLPAQLARIPGVATNATGLPELPRDVSNATFDDVGALVGAAQGIAAQGFSESRRLEASLLNLVAPAYDLLGRTDLFTGDGETTVKAGATLISAPPVDGDHWLAAGRSSGITSLFNELVSSARYAIDVGGEGGLPRYVVLGTDVVAKSIDISGVWPQAGNFATGFAAKVRLESLEDFGVSITFAPGLLSGLVAGWDATKCPDDLWQLDLGSDPSGKKSLAITSRECASTRDQVSQLALARTDATGAWNFTGAFAQSFPEADPQSLRGFLGKRQGFVMQAAATSDVARVAGAAAVLGEADFAAPTQDKIDRFGVGQILARFFQVRYFSPKVAAAEYDDAAYWMCKAPFVASAIQSEVANVSELCDGTQLDVETILGTLKGVQRELKSSGLVPDDIESQVDGMLEVLNIRNTLFVGETGALAYKVAPDQAFASLDEARKTGLPPAVGNTSWLGGAQAVLPKLTQAEIPDTAFKALQSGLGGFLKESCKALAGDAQAKAGKAESAASVCGG